MQSTRQVTAHSFAQVKKLVSKMESKSAYLYNGKKWLVTGYVMRGGKPLFTLEEYIEKTHTRNTQYVSKS